MKLLQPLAKTKTGLNHFLAERISLNGKIMSSPQPSTGFKKLYDTGLLSLIFPEMAALQGVEVKNGIGHKDNFYHTLEVP